MSYSFRFSESGKYIIVDVSSSLTRLQAAQITSEATTLGINNNITGLLIDVRKVSNQEDIHECFKLASRDIVKSKYDHFRKIVLLISEQDTSYSLLVTMFQNAGYRIREMIDEEEATEWLEKTIIIKQLKTSSKG